MKNPLDHVLDFSDRFLSGNFGTYLNLDNVPLKLFDGAAVNGIGVSLTETMDPAFIEWQREIVFADVGKLGQRAAMQLSPGEFVLASLSRPTQIEAYRGAFAKLNFMSNATTKYAIRGIVDSISLGRNMTPLDMDRSERPSFLARALLLSGFISRYNWKCRVWDGERSLSFFTDPLGCREALKLRDLAPGRKRRTAILHWVSEHYRKQRDMGKSFIKEHLRGKETATIRGCRVSIYPSDYDIERSERADLSESADPIARLTDADA